MPQTSAIRLDAALDVAVCGSFGDWLDLKDRAVGMRTNNLEPTITSRIYVVVGFYFEVVYYWG